MNPTKKSLAKRDPGRPTKEKADLIDRIILDVAQRLFFEKSFHETSLEAVARISGMSKRTIYSRYSNKADLFRGVVHRLIQSLKPQSLFEENPTKEADQMLTEIASKILDAALDPFALALYRLIIAEARQFPELVVIVNQEYVRQDILKGLRKFFVTNHTKFPLHSKTDEFLAEQFLQLVIALPQKKALAFGKILNSKEREKWVKLSVALFIKGLSHFGDE